MIKQIFHSRSDSEGGISSFQAFAVGLASRVGTGNIAGVAIALTLGGPGAIFWMWVVAALGMATAFIEATLAQLFKVRSEDGSFRGGPAFYIQRGLHSRAGGVLFAVLLIFTFGVAFNMVQANAISDVLGASREIPTEWTGVVLMVLTAPVLFGGVRRVARVAEIVLPAMALLYVVLACVIVILNINQIGEVFKMIIGGAFGIDELAGGFVGGIAAAMLNGVKRGLFSNEAGMGSAPNAAATATVSHPVKQGFVQSLGVFVDTMVICTSTAFIILVSGPGGLRPGEHRRHRRRHADPVRRGGRARSVEQLSDDLPDHHLRVLLGARELLLRRGQSLLPRRQQTGAQPVPGRRAAVRSPSARSPRSPRFGRSPTSRWH